jgi:hypothetical protein
MTLPTSAEITSRYLFNQSSPPADLTKYDPIAVGTSRTAVTVSASDFFSGPSAPGRFAVPALNEITRLFYGSVVGLPYLAPGEYDRDSMNKYYAAALGPTYSSGRPASNRIEYTQSSYKDSSESISDFSERAYIWQSTSAEFSDDVKFIVYSDGRREIKNAYIVANSDNFDFDSKSLASRLFAYKFEDDIDPSKIGVVVTITVTSKKKVRDSYTAKSWAVYSKQDYIDDLNRIAVWEANAFSALPSAVFGAQSWIKQNLWDTGVVKFLDSDNRPIVYGTAGVESLVDAVNDFQQPYLLNGIHFLERDDIILQHILSL